MYELGPNAVTHQGCEQSCQERGFCSRQQELAQDFMLDFAQHPGNALFCSFSCPLNGGRRDKPQLGMNSRCVATYLTSFHFWS